MPSILEPHDKTLGMREKILSGPTHTLMAGANPMRVAKQGGRATMQMVLTVYSKWIDGTDKSQERGKIDAMFAAESHSNATKTA